MPIATLLRNITCRNCGKSNTKLSISNSKEIKDLKESICDEIKEKLPVLVKDALIETSKRTGFFTKTFAEVVKQQNETVIKNAVKSTSGAAFKEGMMTMGKNMEERQKRHKNLILSSIVENDITAATNSIMFKLCLISFDIVNHTSPSYLTDLFETYQPTTTSNLRVGVGRDEYMLVHNSNHNADSQKNIFTKMTETIFHQHYVVLNLEMLLNPTLKHIILNWLMIIDIPLQY